MKKLFAIFLIAIALSACTTEELAPGNNEQPVETGKQVYTLTVKANKVSSDTKALSLVGKTLSPQWASTDQVSVFAADWSGELLGTLQAAESDNDETTLSGSLTTPPSAGDNLNLLFPRGTWDYTGQTGVLLSDDNSIENKYDYALAQVTVDEVSGGVITTTADAEFTAQQAIVKFILKNKAGDDLPVTSLSISAAGGKLVQNREYAEGGWTPSVCEDYTGTALTFFYLELPWNIGDENNLYVPGFEVDPDFGTNWYKQIDGKYVYRMRQYGVLSPVTAPISIEAYSAVGSGSLEVSGVEFTNGAYYSYVSSSSVSKTIPVKTEAGMQSVYGDINILSSQTNALTVALRNELNGADSYTITTSDGTNEYSVQSPSIQFENGKYYEITVKMPVVDLSSLNEAYQAKDGDILTGTLANKVQISIADGATVTLRNVSINADGNWTGGSGACINCMGNATIILQGTNTVKGYNEDLNATISVSKNKTLIIKGDGSLNTFGYNICSGIGGEGNIEIQDGIINATGATYASGIGSFSTIYAGSIKISGGQVNATGGNYAEGIDANQVKITTGITNVTSKGYNHCISGIMEVSFGTSLVYDGDWYPDPMISGNYGGLTLTISSDGKTWTLTPAS